jgi:hypothetical protein
MRQAGRYLPEYRATRAKAGSFLGLATNPELACEVTLQPLARFPLDAAILFSDILMIPKAMGVGLAFEEGEGPRIENPVQSVRDIDALRAPDTRLGAALRHGRRVADPARARRARAAHRLRGLAVDRRDLHDRRRLEPRLPEVEGLLFANTEGAASLACEARARRRRYSMRRSPQGCRP